VFADDGCHDVAAESRPCLEKDLLLRINIQGGAVGRKTRFQHGRDPGDEGPAKGRCPGQHDLRFVLPDQACHPDGIQVLYRRGQGIGVQDEHIVRPCSMRVSTPATLCPRQTADNGTRAYLRVPVPRQQFVSDAA